MKKLKHSLIEGRLGDFICNFAAVVLGIVITFIGSDMIQEYNKRKEVKQALQLVKSELLLNKEGIKAIMEQEMFEQRGALYLLRYRGKMNEASPDSLKAYSYFPFQTSNTSYTNDALEMLKTSSLMQNIKSKELVSQIIQSYNAIKRANELFKSYMEAKAYKMEKLYQRSDFMKFSNESNSLINKWNFIFNDLEGLTAIQSISMIHTDPQSMYSNHMNYIDITIAAIDKEYT